MSLLKNRPQNGPISILMTGLVICLCAAPATRAGLTINLQLYHNGSAYYLAFPSLNTNDASANPPNTGYFVWSHGSSANSGIHGQVYADGTAEAGSGVYSDYAAFIPEITNSWTLLVTNTVATNSYTFYVTPFTSNSFPAVAVTFPTDGSVDITNQPTFTWQGPTNYTELFVQETDGGNFYENTYLPITQTSWPTPVALGSGSNYFFTAVYNQFYDSNSVPTVAASTPTNNASQPFPGWVSTSVLSTYEGISFTTAGAGTIPLGDAVNAPDLTWTTSGDAPWFGETVVSHDGASAAQSGPITGSQVSILQTTIIGPGTLSFWWQTAADDFDFDLEFDIDGGYYDDISANNAWQQDTFLIPAGMHTLTWTAQTADFTNDTGWVDEFVFTTGQAPVITANPFSQTNYPGYNVALSAAASGSPDPTWQWYKVGSGAIAGATNALYIPTNSGTAGVAGSYFAIASNASGSANTLTAIVSFINAPLPPDWSRAFKSPSFNNNTATEEYYLACLADATGNLYTVASFTGTNTLGAETFISANGAFETMIVKQSASGSLIWARAFTNNGHGSSFPQCVAPAPGDGLYVAGVFSGTNWLGTNALIETAGDSTYLARFDANGNPLWIRTITGTNFNFTGYFCLVADPAGNATLSALIWGYTSFGSTNGVGTNLFASGQEGALVQYDANGALRWAEAPGAWTLHMKYDAGRIYGSMFAPSAGFAGITNATDRRWSIAAINPANGQALWLRGVGAPQDQGNPLGIIDDNPLIAVSGTNLTIVGTAFGSNAAFGPYTVSWPGDAGQYFARYDTNGTPQLATSFGSPTTLTWAVLPDASGNIYLGGDFDNYSQFGPDTIAAPHLDSIGNGYYGAAYVAKFDRNGHPLWVRQAQSQISLVNIRGLALAADGVWADAVCRGPTTFGTNVVYSSVTCIGTPFCTPVYHYSGVLAKITDGFGLLPVTLFNPQKAGANFSFQFLSQAGHTHTILSRTNVEAGVWRTNSTVAGDGTTKTITIVAPASQQFFRVGTQ